MPAFLFTLLIWLIFASFAISFSPETNLTVVIFYVLFFLAAFFTFALSFGNSRRGALAGIAFTATLFLLQIKLFHPLNLILLGGIILSVELYFTRR